MLHTVYHLKFVYRIADLRQGVGETQTVRINPGLQRGVVHYGTYSVVGNHQTVEFLNHRHWPLATERVVGQTLMGVGLIDHQFYLPSLVVGTDQLQSGVLLRIQQRGHQAVLFTIAWSIGIGQDVFDHSNQESLAPLATMGVGRMNIRQKSSVWEAPDRLEFDPGWHPAQKM